MAVIISNDDPITTNTASPVSTDTGWMQDLVVDTQAETVPSVSPISTDISASVVSPETEVITKSIITPEPQKDPLIPNIYIAADQATATKTDTSIPQVTVAPTSDIQKTNPKAINLDELFGNTKTTEIVVDESIAKEKTVHTASKEENKSDHHILQKFMFALAGSLAIIAGGFFIIKTVFPLTFQDNTNDVAVDLATGGNTEVLAQEIHAAPPVKTLAEVYKDKLVVYASSGEFYHEFGRQTRNRDLIKYGLFIHKKSLDLQDDIQKAIVMSGQMDTVSIEAYLAQFDGYIKLLQNAVANDPELQAALSTFTRPPSETEDNTNLAPEASTPEQNTGEEMNTQPTLDQFLNQVPQSE